MKPKHPLLFAACLAVAWAIGAVAQDRPLPPDIVAMPDGVSIQAAGNGGFRILSIASAPCKSEAPAALSTARTVATAKAKAALARFLDETVSVDEFVERESVRVRTADGESSAVAKEDVRRTLVRIKTESTALLRGVKVLGTQFVPAAGGGGTLRLVAAVDSAGIQSAEMLDDAMRAR
jgi:hypothetical protein